MSRLRSFFSGIDWKNQFVSLVVVILGISIAYSLDNWNQARKDANTEREILLSLKADLKKDLEQLKYISDTTRYFQYLNGQLVKVVTGRKNPGDSLSYYIMSLYSFAKFSPTDNTYQSLISSGNMTLVRDFRLSQKIIQQYHQYFSAINSFDEIYEKVMTETIQPYIFANIDFSAYSSENGRGFLGDRFFVNLTFSSGYYISKKIELSDSARVNGQILLEDLENYLE